MERYRIAKEVIGVPSKKGFLEDKSKEYTADHWAEDEAEEKVKEGFLVKVKQEKKEK